MTGLCLEEAHGGTPRQPDLLVAAKARELSPALTFLTVTRITVPLHHSAGQGQSCVGTSALATSSAWTAFS